MRTWICISAIALLAFGFAQQRGKRDDGPILTKRNGGSGPVYKKDTDAQYRKKLDYQLGPATYGGTARLQPQLNARNPWITGANIDFYHAGRWDTTYNSVYCTGIHQTGTSSGEWDGTAAYVTFTPPSTGRYLIVTHFNGTRMRCEVDGPWGLASSSTDQGTEEGVVATIYEATTTNRITFTFHFESTENNPNNWGMGYWHGTEFKKL